MESSEQNAGTMDLRKCLFAHWQGAVMFSLPFVFLIAMFVNDTPPYRCLYVIVAMFICWVTEVFPLAITAMFPIIAFPLMNIMASDKACSLYFKDTLVMFLVSIMIACAIEFTNLHVHVAVTVCHAIGSNPRRLHFLLVAVALYLSVLVPNAVCIAVMCPFTYALLERLSKMGICKMYQDDSPDVPKTEKKPSRIAICFYLSVAYASSMGGSGNLTGSPTNIVFKEIYEARFPYSPDKIDFENYFLYAFPPMLVYSGLMYIIMEYTYMGLFRSSSEDAMALRLTEEEKAAVKRMANEKYESIGPITVAQCTMVTLVIGLIVMMASRKPEFGNGWADVLDEKEIQNTSVTTIFIFLVFSLPARLVFLKCWDERSVEKAAGLLNWKFLNTSVPWDLIFIIGCGGTIAEGCLSSGLASLLGDRLVDLKTLPSPIGLLIAIIVMELCTNLTVNAAVMSVVAPGIIQMAMASKVHPLYLLMPAGLAGSMAFLMPAATAPNALVAAYANIRTKDMIYAGIGPTVASVITIYIFAQSWGSLVYPDLMEFPKWVTENATETYLGE